MNKKIIYFSLSVWALFGACTDEQTNFTPENENNGKVVVRAADTRTEVAFKAGQRIIVYNGVYPQDVVDPELRGIYSAPTTENKADYWTNIVKDTPTDINSQALGLWKNDIKKESNDKYCFTAITYSDGQALLGQGVHKIQDNQSTSENYIKNDFLVARTIYNNEDWKNDGVSLLFYHVLSQLEIKLYLPIGSEADGMFLESIKDTKTKSIILKSTTPDYQVDYSSSGLESGQSAKVSEIKDGGAGPTNVTMLPPSVGISGSEVKVPGEETKAVMFNFNAIIPPHQYYPAGQICLDINLGGKSYSYAPDADGLFSFAQGYKTIIYLVLYSKKGTAKVKLAGVKMNPWKNDKTDIGDLIED